MRPFLSWLLIAIISCHWAGSYIGFEVIYTVEVEPEMSAIEQVISEAVKAETNLDAHITIVSQDQLEMRGNGYGNVFVFSKEINGETIYYKIDPAPKKYLTHEYISKNLPDSDRNQKAALFDQLFSKYTIPQPATSIALRDPSPLKQHFRDRTMQDLHFIQVQTPPPDFM